MPQDNLNKVYGYDHYTQNMPGVTQRRGVLEKIFGARTARRMKSPLFAGTALFLTAGIFASFIMSGAPGNDAQNAVPIVKADALPFKVVPTDAGGMEIPNRESTVYSTMREAALEEPSPIESLIADEEPVDKLAQFAAEVETMEEFAGDASSAPVVASVEPAAGVQALIPEASAPVRKSSTQAPTKPFYDAGSSPETLAFVRSVLERKDQKISNGRKPDSAAPNILNAKEEIARVEPAAGVETPRSAAPAPASVSAPASESTSYYVQLGSVISEKGAEDEWKRLSRIFSAELTGSAHRVQQADLGDRGIYYRIQAGPMSHEMASEVCSSIQAQKTGGCLVTR